jgi:putative membrane protein
MKGKRNNLLLKIVLIGAILYGPYHCSKNDKSNRIAGPNAEKDVQFVINAAEIDLEKIQLGLLAQKKGAVTEVKELGKTIEKAHRRSLTGLSDLATKKSIIIPTALNDEAKTVYEKLSNQSGILFDKEYCEMMINKQKDAIIIFEEAHNESSDADIREWTTTILPVLRKNLDQAIDCQKFCEKI